MLKFFIECYGQLNSNLVSNNFLNEFISLGYSEDNYLSLLKATVNNPFCLNTDGFSLSSAQKIDKFLLKNGFWGVIKCFNDEKINETFVFIERRTGSYLNEPIKENRKSA